MKNLIFVLVMGWAFQGMAQPGENIKKMEELSYMVGSWNGGGWRMNQTNRTREEFTQAEQIGYELNGAALLVKGQGYSSDQKLIHNALGIIFYSEEEGYKMFALLENGMKTDANLEIIEPGKFNWGFDTNGGSIKYSVVIENGVWTEKGAFSPDQENWYPFIQFSLKKN